MQTASDFVRVKMEASPLPNPPDPGPEPKMDEDLAILGKEADELLHYGQLKRAANSPHDAWERKQWSMNYHYDAVCQKVRAENHLAEVLAELEIDVVDHESVSRYRDELLQELTKPKHTGRFAWFLNIFETSPEFRWRRIEMEKHASIPPDTLKKAIQIKKCLPKAKFYVKRLVEVQYWFDWDGMHDIRRESYIQRSFYFLVVDYDGEIYQSEKRRWDDEYNHQTYEHIERYIDVWEK